MIKVKKLKTKYRYTNTIRILFQSIILLLLVYVAVRPFFDAGYVADFEAYCPFGGLSALMSKWNLGSLSCQMGGTQIMLGLALLAAAFLVGKLFCSYICPIGSVSEWLGKIGDKFHLRIKMPNLLDRGFRIFKYALLFVSVYFTMVSSELFCKEFDPYYAVVTGFASRDIVLYFALPALLITILGAIFFRLFWCKYLCPLGAVTNIFNNIIPTIVVIAIYVAANLFGADLGLVWLLGGLVLVGMITEVGFMRSFSLSLTKIKREPSTCTMCGLCDDSCPEGIKVSEYETVNHVDCNLCTDCVYSCPVNNTLTISGKKSSKYLAPAAVIIFIALGFIFADNYEIATLSERWGGFENVKHAKVLEIQGLKTVKCFGSATSFKNQISRFKGIKGLDAYAGSHTVKIYYDPEVTNAEKIKSEVFSPMKMRVRRIKGEVLDSITVAEFKIEKLFDRVDHTNLVYALRKDKAVFGMATHFGEPILVDVYYDASKTTPEEIKKVMKADEVSIKYSNGKIVNNEIDFDVYDDWQIKGKIPVAEYNAIMFSGFDRKFNHYSKYKLDELNVLIYPMPEAANSTLAKRLSYLVSHLSNEKGIVRFSTRFINGPKALVYFNPKLITIERVKAAISSPIMKVHFRGGEVKEVKNPYKSKPDGKVFPATKFINKKI
jgi:polyferredoxin